MGTTGRKSRNKNRSGSRIVRPLEMLESRRLLSASAGLISITGTDNVVVTPSGANVTLLPSPTPTPTPTPIVSPADPTTSNNNGGSTTTTNTTAKSIAGYTPAQITAAYGFNQAAAALGGSGGAGAGQTIAIVDAYHDKTLVSDVTTFDQQFGISTATITQLNQTGSAPSASSDATWSQETALDVEWAHAIAPAANIVVVEANTDKLSDLLTAVATARSLPDVSVVSMSWGVNEFASETKFDYLFTTPAGHEPITFLASAGDTGANQPLQWPGTSPNVVSVGGSSSTSTGTDADALWAGSTIGSSAYESATALQGVPARAVPDVEYNANPSPGFAVYDSASGGWTTVGGTSAGAPQWAALVAIANEARAAKGMATLDGVTQTLPAIYAYSQGTLNAGVVTISDKTTISGPAPTEEPSTTPPASTFTASGTGAAQFTLTPATALTFSNQLASVTTNTTPAGNSNGASVSTQTPPSQAGSVRATAWIVTNLRVTPAEVLAASNIDSAADAGEYLRSLTDTHQTLASAAPVAGAQLAMSDTNSPAARNIFAAAVSNAAPLPRAAGAPLSRTFTGAFTISPRTFSDSDVTTVDPDGVQPIQPLPVFVAHVNFAGAFTDAVTSFINEAADGSRTVAVQEATPAKHARAWAITFGVIAADLLVLHRFVLRGKKQKLAKLPGRDEGFELVA